MGISADCSVTKRQIQSNVDQLFLRQSGRTSIGCPYCLKNDEDGRQNGGMPWLTLCILFFCVASCGWEECLHPIGGVGGGSLVHVSTGLAS